MIYSFCRFRAVITHFVCKRNVNMLGVMLRPPSDPFIGVENCNCVPTN